VLNDEMTHLALINVYFMYAGLHEDN